MFYPYCTREIKILCCPIQKRAVKAENTISKLKQDLNQLQV